MESIKLSPLRSVLRKNISDVKESTKRYYKRKANESIDSLLDLIAPKQGQDLKEEVIPTPSCAQMQKDQEADVISTLTKLYVDTVDNSLKTQILSVISSKLTKAEIQSLIPGITIYRIDQARQQLNTSSERGLHIREKLKVPRRRMDEDKLQHAISFFFDPSFMQLVSYGTRDLKLESGEIITIPDVIRTTNHSKIVDLYLSYCRESNFIPLGQSTLFRILNTCSATKRTNMHGLDNIAAEGIEGFQAMKEIIDDLYQKSCLTTSECDALQETVNSAKLYFKTDYKLHLQKHSLCADHCLNWLLSDPGNQNFQHKCDHIHSLDCDRCRFVRNIEKDVSCAVQKIQDTDLREEATKTFTDAMQKIHDWKSHIIRNVNQDQFRTHVIQELKRFEGLIVMDWAMKFLPMRFREKQTDWFGQRGKHWHVIVCIYRDENGEIGVSEFTHRGSNLRNLSTYMINDEIYK